MMTTTSGMMTRSPLYGRHQTGDYRDYPDVTQRPYRFRVRGLRVWGFKAWGFHLPDPETALNERRATLPLKPALTPKPSHS